MKAVAISDQKLLDLCTRIRQLNQLSLKERRAVIEVILREIDLVKRIDQEQLVCIQHAKTLRGYSNHSTIYRLAQRGRLRVFTICCRDFFDRTELEALPIKGSQWRKSKVKVGMVGVKKQAE